MSVPSPPFAWHPNATGTITVDTAGIDTDKLSTREWELLHPTLRVTSVPRYTRVDREEGRLRERSKEEMQEEIDRLNKERGYGKASSD